MTRRDDPFAFSQGGESNAPAGTTVTAIAAAPVLSVSPVSAVRARPSRSSARLSLRTSARRFSVALTLPVPAVPAPTVEGMIMRTARIKLTPGTVPYTTVNTREPHRLAAQKD